MTSTNLGSLERCTRLNKTGSQCLRPAAVRAFPERPWLTAARTCRQHLTPAEKLLYDHEEALALNAEMAREERDPACWSWPVPNDPFEPSLDEIAVLTKLGGKLRLDDAGALASWQGDRCPLCGRTGRVSVLDHDHLTGMARGWLCRSCNLKEGHADGRTDVYARWRARPAAAVLGVRFAYISAFGLPSAVDDPEWWSDYRYLPEWAPPDRSV